MSFPITTYHIGISRTTNTFCAFACVRYSDPTVVHVWTEWKKRWILLGTNTSDYVDGFLYGTKRADRLTLLINDIPLIKDDSNILFPRV
jgi:hypothetical protein